MLVLVLNTGSSSIKFELIDPTTGERHGGGVVEEVVDHEAALAAVVAVTRRPDRRRRRAPCRPRRRGVQRADRHRRRRARHAALAGAAGAVAQPGEHHGHRGGPAALARRAAGRRVRHRLPSHTSGPRLPLRRAGRVVRAPRRAALRLPRDVPRLRRRAGGGGARPAKLFDGIVAHLGNGASITAIVGRPQRRHVDGVVAAGRAGDGYSLGRRRSDGRHPRRGGDGAADRGRVRRPQPHERAARSVRRVGHARDHGTGGGWRRCGSPRHRRVRLPDQEVRRCLPRCAGRPVRRARVHRRDRPAQRCRAGRGVRRARRRSASCSIPSATSGATRSCRRTESPIAVLVIATDEELEIARETAELWPGPVRGGRAP